MQIVGLEEHVVVPQLPAAWLRLPGMHQAPEAGLGDEPLAQKLRDAGDQRLADMDSQGVDIQVLSLNTPGVQNLAPSDAVTVARLGFRGTMLYGRTGATNADDRRFAGLYAMAARLHSPIYLHPQIPVAPVREAYYSAYGDKINAMFANFGIGWYYETGVQLLRMIFSGVFDRHPGLQVIIGHWGELVLFYLEHTAVMQAMGLRLDRPLADYFRQNVWVTCSGLYSERYLRWSAEVVGIDRIMYSTDYPFRDTSGGTARAFLENAPLTQAEKAAIGSGNWERLIGHLGLP